MEFQLQHQSFQLTPRTDLLQDGLVGSPCSPRDSQESSLTPQSKSINSLELSFIVQLSHPYMTTGKTIALTRRTFVDKVMSLLFNILFRTQMVKRLPTMWEIWVQSLGREDPLEKEMATHSTTLAWKIPWTEETGGLQTMGSQRVGHD